MANGKNKKAVEPTTKSTNGKQQEAKNKRQVIAQPKLLQHFK